jgi:hypothetical protein
VTLKRKDQAPGAVPGAAGDPTEHSLWRPLRLLQEAMDAEIARVYAEAGIRGLKPSYVIGAASSAGSSRRSLTRSAGSWPTSRKHYGAGVFTTGWPKSWPPTPPGASRDFRAHRRVVPHRQAGQFDQSI